MTRTTTPDVWYRIFGTLIRDTGKAYLWKLPSEHKEFWMPISQTRNLNVIPDEDGHISIEVKEWILDDKAVPPSQRYDLAHPGPGYQSAGNSNPNYFKGVDDLDDDCPF